MILVEHQCNPISSQYWLTRCILLLEIYSKWFLNFQEFIYPLLITNANTFPFSISQNKLYFTTWNFIPVYFLISKHRYAPCWSLMETSSLLNITKHYILYCWKSNSDLFLNFQSFICPLLSINATPITYQHHKIYAVLYCLET